MDSGNGLSSEVPVPSPDFPRVLASLDPFFRIGEVLGVRGGRTPWWKVAILPDLLPFFQATTWVFLTVLRKPLPVEIIAREAQNPQEGIWFVQFRHIQDRYAWASRLVNSWVLALRADLERFFQHHPASPDYWLPPSLWLDFTVVDSNQQVLGPIQEVRHAHRLTFLVLATTPPLFIPVEQVERVDFARQSVFLKSALAELLRWDEAPSRT